MFLAMMVVLRWSWRVTITPELFITGELSRVEQRAGFQMRRQMHCAEPTL
jgi:hypothetical protein